MQPPWKTMSTLPSFFSVVIRWHHWNTNSDGIITPCAMWIVRGMQECQLRLDEPHPVPFVLVNTSIKQLLQCWERLQQCNILRPVHTKGDNNKGKVLKIIQNRAAWYIEIIEISSMYVSQYAYLLKKYLPSGHPRFRWVCFFTKQIKRNLALHHLLTSGSSAVNGCRQNESPNSWLKHHNNSQAIHTSPVQQLTSCEVKSDVFAMNKFII